MSDLVGNPNCWFSHAHAQMVLLRLYTFNDIEPFIRSLYLSLLFDMLRLRKMMPLVTFILMEIVWLKLNSV